MFRSLALVGLFSLAVPAFPNVFLSGPTVSPEVSASPLTIDESLSETFTTNIPSGAFTSAPCGTINFYYKTNMGGGGGILFASIVLGSASPTIESVTVNPNTLPPGTYSIAARFDGTACAPGALIGLGNTDGELITVINIVTNPGTDTTFTQGGWGSKPHGGNPGALLANNFGKVFGSAGVTIGISGGLNLKFDSATAIRNFLPATGTPGALTASATDPTTSSAGVFAGQVLALELSVAFSNAGITGSGLGSLHVQSGPLAGQTVAQVLAEANIALGGGPLPAGVTSISALSDIVDQINSSCDGGVCNGFIA